MKTVASINDIFPVNANVRSISILSILPSIPTTICSDCVCASRSPSRSSTHLHDIQTPSPFSVRIVSDPFELSSGSVFRASKGFPSLSVRFDCRVPSVIPATKRTPGVDRFRRMLTRAGEREQVRGTLADTRVRELYGKVPDTRSAWDVRRLILL